MFLAFRSLRSSRIYAQPSCLASTSFPSFFLPLPPTSQRRGRHYQVVQGRGRHRTVLRIRARPWKDCTSSSTIGNERGGSGTVEKNTRLMRVREVWKSVAASVSADRWLFMQIALPRGTTVPRRSPPKLVSQTCSRVAIHIYSPPYCFPFLTLCPSESQDYSPHTRAADSTYSLHSFPRNTTTVVSLVHCRKYYRLRWIQRSLQWWSRSESGCACSLFLSLLAMFPV